MREYVVSVVAVSTLAALAVFISYGGASERAVKGAVSVILIYTLCMPIVDMVGDFSVENLNFESSQGDMACYQLFADLSSNLTIPCGDIPDLVPILSVVAATKCGATFENIRRLRLKESDRVASVIAMLASLGCLATATEDILTVLPGKFKGGTIDACGDHRIAMAAAIAATAAQSPVTIQGAECVSKSYPGFWEEYKRLGGQYELDLR